MSLININNLIFAYESGFKNVFENVSFNIDSNWKIGLIGRNGKGKTTLLKLLVKEYEFKGSITSKLHFKYFPFFIENKEENVIDIINKLFPNILDWQLIKEISLLNVQIEVLYRPYSTLSNGEQIKVLLAALFLCEESFFLLDEPTNHLDMQTKQLIKDYLKHKKGYILVSHDRDILNECVDHILVIENSKINLQKGNFDTYNENKKRQEHYENVQNEALNKDIKRLSKASKENTMWANQSEKKKNEIGKSGLRPDKGFISHKAAKIMKRAKTYEKKVLNAIEEKKELLKDIDKQEDLKIQGLDYFKTTLVEIKDLVIFYDNKAICKPLNLQINRNDKLAIIGKNGSGKSSLLKLINKQNIQYKGVINTNNQLVISYVPQDTSFEEKTLDEFILKFSIDSQQFKAILRKLGFDKEQFNLPLNQYSEGQKKKVLIAKSLCEKAHLYIWDEPLNYIDVLSRMQIEELLKQVQITMIFVEHDQSFIKSIATKTICF